MADRNDEKGFLSRWARRKDEARRAPAEPPEPEPRPQQAAAQPEPASDRVEAPLELPDVETLSLESDFTLFLRAGVPEDLRRRALRKLWRLDPVFANLDGLNDYDEDYGLLHKMGGLGGVRTAYRVGQGMPAAERLEAAREAIAAREERPTGEPADRQVANESPGADQGEQHDSEEPVAAEAPQEGPAVVSEPGRPPEPAAASSGQSVGKAAVERRWGGFRT